MYQPPKCPYFSVSIFKRENNCKTFFIWTALKLIKKDKNLIYTTSLWITIKVDRFLLQKEKWRRTWNNDQIYSFFERAIFLNISIWHSLNCKCKHVKFFIPLLLKYAAYLAFLVLMKTCLHKAILNPDWLWNICNKVRDESYPLMQKNCKIPQFFFTFYRVSFCLIFWIFRRSFGLMNGLVTL